jgi:hypothetical protein
MSERYSFLQLKAQAYEEHQFLAWFQVLFGFVTRMNEKAVPLLHGIYICRNAFYFPAEYL